MRNPDQNSILLAQFFTDYPCVFHQLGLGALMSEERSQVTQLELFMSDFKDEKAAQVLKQVKALFPLNALAINRLFDRLCNITPLKTESMKELINTGAVIPNHKLFEQVMVSDTAKFSNKSPPLAYDSWNETKRVCKPAIQACLEVNPEFKIINSASWLLIARSALSDPLDGFFVTLLQRGFDCNQVWYAGLGLSFLHYVAYYGTPQIRAMANKGNRTNLFGFSVSHYKVLSYITPEEEQYESSEIKQKFENSNASMPGATIAHCADIFGFFPKDYVACIAGKEKRRQALAEIMQDLQCEVNIRQDEQSRYEQLAKWVYQFVRYSNFFEILIVDIIQKLRFDENGKFVQDHINIKEAHHLLISFVRSTLLDHLQAYNANLDNKPARLIERFFRLRQAPPINESLVKYNDLPQSTEFIHRVDMFGFFPIDYVLLIRDQERQKQLIANINGALNNFIRARRKPVVAVLGKVFPILPTVILERIVEYLDVKVINGSINWRAIGFTKSIKKVEDRYAIDLLLDEKISGKKIREWFDVLALEKMTPFRGGLISASDNPVNPHPDTMYRIFSDYQQSLLRTPPPNNAGVGNRYNQEVATMRFLGDTAATNVTVQKHAEKRPELSASSHDDTSNKRQKR